MLIQRKALAFSLQMQVSCNGFIQLSSTNRRTTIIPASSRSDDPIFSNNNTYEHLKQPRRTQILAKPIDIVNCSILKESLPSNSKIVHFQRHGQGTHNEIYAQWTESTGVPLNLSETDPAKNPLLLPHVIDAPLTQKGIHQCIQQYELNAENLKGVERIIVSPLVRALQTAQLTFRDHTPNAKNITTIWTAHEGCREELGMLLCNKRRPLTETISQFPNVDFSLIPGEEDTMWDDYANSFEVIQRESMDDMSHRVYDFLEGYVRHLPEKEVAVVGHSAWLYAMCKSVLDHDAHHQMIDTTMFGQSEIRTLELTFNER